MDTPSSGGGNVPTGGVQAGNAPTANFNAEASTATTGSGSVGNAQITAENKVSTAEGSADGKTDAVSGGSVEAGARRGAGPSGVAVANGGAGGLAENQVSSQESNARVEAGGKLETASVSADARESAVEDHASEAVGGTSVGGQVGRAEATSNREQGRVVAQTDAAGEAHDRASVVAHDPRAAAAGAASERASTEAEYAVREHTPDQVTTAENKADAAERVYANPTGAATAEVTSKADVTVAANVTTEPKK